MEMKLLMGPKKWGLQETWTLEEDPYRIMPRLFERLSKVCSTTSVVSTTERSGSTTRYTATLLL